MHLIRSLRGIQHLQARSYLVAILKQAAPANCWPCLSNCYNPRDNSFNVRFLDSNNHTPGLGAFHKQNHWRLKWMQCNHCGYRHRTTFMHAARSNTGAGGVPEGRMGESIFSNARKDAPRQGFFGRAGASQNRGPTLRLAALLYLLALWHHHWEMKEKPPLNFVEDYVAWEFKYCWDTLKKFSKTHEF